MYIIFYIKLELLYQITAYRAAKRAPTDHLNDDIGTISPYSNLKVENVVNGL